MNKEQVRNFLYEQKLYPIKKFGQNFLINQSVIQCIVDRVQKHKFFFVEIGPGPGALTKHFIDKKQQILLIERDKKIAGYWKGKSFSVLSADVLRLEWSSVLPKTFMFFGNLPYQISGRLILKSSLYQERIQAMVFLIQKEVAQKVRAKVNTKNYGLLSVISQVFWDISVVADVPKTDFYPSPKVDGRVLEFTRKAETSELDPKRFLNFVKKCFSFKRKMLFKQMGIQSFDEARSFLKSLSLSDSCRAQELSPKKFIDLYKTLSVDLKIP